MAIIMIEGPRHVGKSFLIDRFFEQNKNPNVYYYKFKFAKYIDELQLRDQETGPGVHYFSIANVLTILELNKTLFKDKILIFDRCIFSAYVWSIYRERMECSRLLNEFKIILDGTLYQNVKLFYIEREESISLPKREKDYFGNFENMDREKELFEKIFLEFNQQVNDSSRHNQFNRMINTFNDESSMEFNRLLNNLINKDELS